MNEALQKAKLAKKAASGLAQLSTDVKDKALGMMAQALEEQAGYLMKANKLDVEAAVQSGKAKAFIDRLTLTEKRIKDMADGLRVIQNLQDPVGETVAMWKRPNGLRIGQRRVPLGVIGIIYESRPNVTADAAGLCLKAGNAVILRGGSEAIQSNKAIVKVLSQAAYEAGIPEGAIQLIEDTGRDSAMLMRLNGSGCTYPKRRPQPHKGSEEAVPVIKRVKLPRCRRMRSDMAVNITVSRVSRPAV